MYFITWKEYGHTHLAMIPKVSRLRRICYTESWVALLKMMSNDQPSHMTELQVTQKYQTACTHIKTWNLISFPKQLNYWCTNNNVTTLEYEPFSHYIKEKMSALDPEIFLTFKVYTDIFNAITQNICFLKWLQKYDVYLRDKNKAHLKWPNKDHNVI